MTEKEQRASFFSIIFSDNFRAKSFFLCSWHAIFFSLFCLTKFDRAGPGYPPLSSLFFIFFRFFFLAFLRFRAMLPAVFRDARKTVSSVFFIPLRFFFLFFSRERGSVLA